MQIHVPHNQTQLLFTASSEKNWRKRNLCMNLRMSHTKISPGCVRKQLSYSERERERERKRGRERERERERESLRESVILCSNWAMCWRPQSKD